VNEEMVSSWTGISGVPGLGYSLPPKEACDLSETSSPAKSGKNGTSGSPWSANSAQNLASLKVDLPRVTNHHHHHHHYYPEIARSRASTSGPNQAVRLQSLSAVNHLMSDAQYFERHNPNNSISSGKKPLRATVTSRLKSKLSLPAAWPVTGHAEDPSPSSLPSHIIPRAPIPTPEVLSNAKKQAKSEMAKSVKHPVSKKDDFSANNDKILSQAGNNLHYSSPKERDGDYSYAYDCSISPAVVIKWNEENPEEESDSDYCDRSRKGSRNKGKDNNENIYEEIQDVSDQHRTGGSSATSSVNNSDSGIGGATVIPPRSHLRHTSQGTLDVSRPSRSHKSNHHKPLKSKTQSNSKENQEKGKTLSSLDALISQTSPELTAHQRLKLRKSLVDELFEELIQRHHARVLDELRLDVEEFIAPSPLHSPSARVTSGLRTRCESMDFQQQKKPQTSATKPSSANNFSAKFWQSARKCSEVIFSAKKSKSAESNAAAESKASADKSQYQPSQVSRKGHRPLSAIVVTSSHNSNNSNRNNVILSKSKILEAQKLDHQGADDSDSESETDARRLLRSQIIKSFWEQHHDNENSDTSDFEETSSGSNNKKL
jgi:hypothetical protein